MRFPSGRFDSNYVWVNSNLPQTLHIAHFLMYFRGGFDLLQAIVFGSGLTGLFNLPLFLMVYWLITVPGQIAAAFGIANKRRWGYRLGVIAAVAQLCLRLLIGLLTFSLSPLFSNPVGLLFDVALLALLLHASSREYASDWD